MANHTPGPWETNGTTIETTKTPSVVVGRAYDEAESGGGIESDSEAEANARLFAAAPDLYAALRAWVESTDRAEQTGSMRPVYDAAKAALFKVA